ncbi:hypothetical protein SAMN05216559_2473 [Halomicrobium zhouii]|uniref:Uncharacterized protein n=1 Tax=Halomicrobium zhouii TaxID=767519 RepID=A0A1I6LCY0_9EURY|nr:hypothetical protein [Halomicrobium zhouii]SFS01274.1 hypothetical protein SAMN05216559_2473 [Halomicrobium zhouii]
MRTVRDADGDRYLLLKESSESSRVRDPETGEERHVPNDELEPVDGESPLETAAKAVPEPARRLVTAVPDKRALGLLVEVDDRGPLDVHVLLDSYDLCESDLHGLLAEFRAAGLVEETDVAGRRGYQITDAGHDALARLRD